MNEDNNLTISYMQQVVGWQPRLYAFALSLTANPNEADDVLQNTNKIRNCRRCFPPCSTEK